VGLGPRLSPALGGVPVTLENDVRAAMLGEHGRGAGRPYTNLIGVFLGTGVGGGLVLDGKLREGRGAAGEIGHLIVKPGGRMCSDGRRGHLEAYAGRASMEARARRLVERGKHTSLFRLMEKKGRERLSSGIIAQAAEEKDDVARSLIDDAAWALSIALASMQNLLDLEAVIIGGGMGDRLGQPFADRVAGLLQPLLFVPERPPVMLSTELGDLSGAVGAAILVGG
jgi:glucokinase